MSEYGEPWVGYVEPKGFGDADAIYAGPPGLPPGTAYATFFDESKMRRAVACVNACAVLQDPERDVADMVDALRVMVDAFGPYVPDPHDPDGECADCKAIERARALLSRIEAARPSTREGVESGDAAGLLQQPRASDSYANGEPTSPPPSREEKT